MAHSLLLLGMVLATAVSSNGRVLPNVRTPIGGTKRPTSETISYPDSFYGDGCIPGMKYKSDFSMEKYFDNFNIGGSTRNLGGVSKMAILSYYDTFLNDDIIPEEYETHFSQFQYQHMIDKSTTTYDYDYVLNHSPMPIIPFAYYNFWDKYINEFNCKIFYNGDQSDGYSFVKPTQFQNAVSLNVEPTVFVDYFLSIGVPIVISHWFVASMADVVIYAKKVMQNETSYKYYAIDLIDEHDTMKAEDLFEKSANMYAIDFTNCKHKCSDNYRLYDIDSNDNLLDTYTSYCPCEEGCEKPEYTEYPIIDLRGKASAYSDSGISRSGRKVNYSRTYTINDKNKVYKLKKLTYKSNHDVKNTGWYVVRFENSGNHEKGYQDFSNGSVNIDLTIGGPIFIYDKFETVYYTNVAYNLNGGKKVDSGLYPSRIERNSGVYNLDVPVKEGYSFTGWQIVETGEIIESLDSDVLISDSITLKAQWEAITYSITYKTSGGRIVALKNRIINSYTITTKSFTLPKATRSYYKLLGWSDENGNILTVFNPKNYLRDVTLTAVWEPVKYTIEYMLPAGAIMPNNPTIYDITMSEFTLLDSSLSGYTFKGWFDENGNNVVSINPKAVHSNLKLIGKFDIITYSISYVLDGGIIPQGKTNPTTYSQSSSSISLVSPSKDGYTFKGWKINGIGSIVQEIPANTTGDICMYAIFEQNSPVIPPINPPTPGPDVNPEIIDGLTSDWLKENFMEHYFVGSPGDPNHRAWTSYHSSLDLNYVSNVKDVDYYLDYLLQNYQFDFDHHTTSGVYNYEDYYLDQDPNTGRWYTSNVSGIEGVCVEDPEGWPCVIKYGAEVDETSIPANNDMCKVIKMDQTNYVILTEVWPCCNDYNDILMISNKYDPNFERFAQYNGMSIYDFMNKGNILYEAPAIKVLNIGEMLYIINDVTEDPGVNIIANSPGDVFGSQLDYLYKYDEIITNPQIIANTGLILANNTNIAKFISMFSYELDDMNNLLGGIGAIQFNDMATIIENMDYANQSDWDIFLALYAMLFHVQLVMNEIDLYAGSKTNTLAYLVRYGFFMANDIVEQLLCSNYLDIISDYPWELLMGQDFPAPSYTGTQVFESQNYLYDCYVYDNPFC